MGCSIHTIVEIRKNGKWEFVEEVPSEFEDRNYNLFGFLANVRNSFDAQGFEVRGLPDDISAKKFKFESITPHILQRYESGTERRCKTFSGEIISVYDEKIKRFLTKEEYDNFKKSEINSERYSTLCQSWNGGEYEYSVYDADMVGGKFVDVPINELYATLEEYKKEYEDEWNEEAQDYGEWKFDFVDKEWHSHSYLSLQELIDKDKSDYLSVKYKMSRAFYNKFIADGGKFPDTFTFREKREDCGTLMDVFAEAFDPTILCSWRDEEKEKNDSLIKGIEGLKTIAEKYSISDYNDIRIVFAFDC